MVTVPFAETVIVAAAGISGFAALTAAATAFLSFVDKLERLFTYVIVGSAGVYLSVCSLYLMTKVTFEET